MSKETPSIEEVREYFKYALEVRCVNDSRVITKFNGVSYYDDGYGEFYYTGESPDSSNLNSYSILLNDIKSYAEITKYSINDVREKFDTRYKDKEVNGMDVIDLCKHWNLNFNDGNVLKYLLRDKGDRIGDLEKIIDYAQRELKHKKNN